MNADPVVDLLNKVSAVIKSKVSSFKKLASDTGIPVKELYQIVNYRRTGPSGERALILHQWAARKSNQIAALPREVQRKYRAAFLANCEKFPISQNELKTSNLDRW